VLPRPYAGQVKGLEPDKERHHGPPGWGLGVRLTTSHHKTKLFRNQSASDGRKNGGRLFRKPKLTLSCSAEGKEGRIINITIHHIYTKLTNWKQYVGRIENSTGLKKA
jgi:hypothetical protein